MSLQDYIAKGTIVSTGAAQTININAGFDTFILRNRTTLAAGAGIVESKWWLGMNNGTAETKTLGGGVLTDAIITAAGFTYKDSSTATLGAAVAVTAVSQAVGAVANTGTTPVVGQIVRIYGTTQMLQIAGMDFTVTAVNPGVSMTFGYLDSSGFLAAANAGNYRLVNQDGTFYPRRRYITAITRGVTTTVQMSVTTDFVAGEKVYFNVPAAFGTSQLNGLTGTILSVNTVTNSIVVDIDSSAFTAFAFPTSAVAALGVTFPQVVPAGELGTLLTGAVRDIGSRSITIGTAVCGTAADVMDYWAFKGQPI